jgi:integrase
MSSDGVYKRVGKSGRISWRWIADGGRDENGKRITETGTCPSEKDAREARLRAAQRLRAGLVPVSRQTSLTLAAWLRRWIKGRVDLGEKTRHRYNQIIETQIIPHIGHYHLSSLSSSTIQGFYSDLLLNGRTTAEGGLAPASVLLVHHILNKALKDAVAADDVRLLRNPMISGINLPRVETTELNLPSREELAQIISAAKDTTWEALVIVAVFTGARRGELLALRWDDVDLATGHLTIQRSLGQVGRQAFIKEPKTQSGRRTLILPKIAIDALRRQLARQNACRKKLGEGYHESELIFTQNDGSTILPDSISCNFHRLCDKAKVKRIRFHDLRHMQAVMLLEQGVNPKVIQSRLGHRDIRTTLQRYSHVTDWMQQDAADRLDGVLPVPADLDSPIVKN